MRPRREVRNWVSLETGKSTVLDVGAGAGGAVAWVVGVNEEVVAADGTTLAGAEEPKVNPPEGGGGIPSSLTADGMKPELDELTAGAGAPEPKANPALGGCGIAEDFDDSAGSGVVFPFWTGLSASGGVAVDAPPNENPANGELVDFDGNPFCAVEGAETLSTF